MRVTNNTVYKNFSSSVNDVHSRLNKSMNKVSSGKAYESAAENPLAYYNGKKIDNQFQDVLNKQSLITNVKNRLYEQESGALSIQDELTKAKSKIQALLNETNNGDKNFISTTKADLLQKAQSMVNDLNGQYQNYYIYGGGDTKTAPFSLSADGKTLTYSHQFPGETTPSNIKMTLEEDPDNPGSFNYNISDEDLDKIRLAMKEQGRVDIGYGDISDRDTLMDTFVGGLNLLTGLNSDAMKASSATSGVTNDMLRERLNNNPIALLGKAVATIDEYSEGNITKDQFTSNLSSTMDIMTDTEHTISTVYSDLGNKYGLLEKLEKKFSGEALNLQQQYKDLLGADPYEAITEMYANQYAYSSALKVGSNLVQASLFDFIR